MRKVIAALITTAAGLAALLSFRSHTGAVGIGALAGAGTTTSALTTPVPSASSTLAGGSDPPGVATPSTSPSATVTAATGRAKDGTYTGTAADTRFGPVQVRATVSGGKLTEVTVLQVPDSGRYEQQIVTVALPILHSEALSKQSASIDIVSGATYTSQGYAQSLQSALDQAGL